MVVPSTWKDGISDKKNLESASTHSFAWQLSRIVLRRLQQFERDHLTVRFACRLGHHTVRDTTSDHWRWQHLRYSPKSTFTQRRIPLLLLGHRSIKVGQASDTLEGATVPLLVILGVVPTRTLTTMGARVAVSLWSSFRILQKGRLGSRCPSQRPRTGIRRVDRRWIARVFQSMNLADGWRRSWWCS